MEELTLTVVYTSKPGMREKFIQEVISRGLLDLIRAEEGCIAYGYYASEDDDDRLMLIEKWENESYQKLHMEQPHMKELLSIKEHYIDTTKIEHY